MQFGEIKRERERCGHNFYTLHYIKISEILDVDGDVVLPPGPELVH